MTETRTGPAVRKVVEAIQSDLREAGEHLQKGREIIAALESDARGVNGLASFLSARRKALDETISGLDDEAQAVERKMLGGKPEMSEHVDEELAAEVAEARGGPLARPDPTT